MILCLWLPSLRTRLGGLSLWCWVGAAVGAGGGVGAGVGVRAGVGVGDGVGAVGVVGAGEGLEVAPALRPGVPSSILPLIPDLSNALVF